MDAVPDFKGEALLLAHVINDELYRHCESLIPDRLKDRVKIADKLPNAVRDKVIANSVAIFPAGYESFCLAAYEASRLGALVLLNGSNPAFGPNTNWEDGVNCEKFDGTAHNLIILLQNMWSRRQSLKHERVTLTPAHEPYWLKAANSSQASNSDSKPKRLSLIIATSDEFGHPTDTIYSALQTGDSILKLFWLAIFSRLPRSELRFCPV